MLLTVSARYLWLPVYKAGNAVKLHFYADGEKFQETDIIAGEDPAEYYAPMDLGRFTSREIEVRGEGAEEYLRNPLFRDEPPAVSAAYRPLLHFTAPTGWINDPNGLVYVDGVYHLFHQWNPYGTEWGNMHWGHAVSRDLVTWEHRGIALAPDEFGTVYSGCAWQDRANAAGFGKDALLFFYTASGGRNRWSADAGRAHTQRLAVSRNHGETLEKSGLILDHIAGENRDPKVFFHRESGAYIMVLYLDGSEFAVFRSADLLRWTESQRFSADPMWECPDLFELPVEGCPDEKKWIFWSADGTYLVGSFDGFRFTPETKVLRAYDTKLPYAAQTWAGITDRVITTAWLRTRNDRDHCRGMMSVPAELSLAVHEGEYILRFRPAREILRRFENSRVIQPGENPCEIPLSGEPTLVRITWTAESPGEIRIGNTALRPAAGTKETMILLDHGIIEYFDRGGLRYGALEAAETVLQDTLRIPAGAKRVCLERGTVLPV